MLEKLARAADPGRDEWADIAGRDREQDRAAAVERIFAIARNSEERLRRGLELANEEIYSHALANPELKGMGTTAVVALLSLDRSVAIAWVGDSRCYRLRDNTLESLTRDHSLMAEWIAIGVISPDAAITHPRRHELTRGRHRPT